MLSSNKIFYPYTEWECYKNGMWRTENINYEAIEMPKIIEFTSNHILYGLAMFEVQSKWIITCTHHLIGYAVNGRSFIGHAACCFMFGWPEYLVRKAWGLITATQQTKANYIAEQAVNKFVQTYKYAA